MTSISPRTHNSFVAVWFLFMVHALLAAASPLLLAKRDAGASNPIAELPSQAFRQVTTQSAIFGVLLILCGMILCLFGRRLVRPVLFIAGFWMGAVIGWAICAAVEPPPSRWVFFAVCIAVGVVIGVVAIFVYKVGLALLGALSGLQIALFILHFRDDGLINSDGGRIAFLVCMAVLGLVLILVLEKYLLIGFTASLGAYMTFIGIDFFAHTGYSFIVQLSTTDDPVSYELTPAVWGMIAGEIAFFLIGILFQYRDSRNAEVKKA